MLLQKEPYSDSEIQKLTFSYERELMWFKAYWIPLSLTLITLIINIWFKAIVPIFIYSIINTLFGSMQYSRYKSLMKTKKELDYKLAHNNRIIEKTTQVDADLNALNFFKT
jgi:hypothetical protein